MFWRTGQGVIFCGEVNIKGALAKASMKMRESQGIDQKPDDLIMNKTKSLEIGMEAWTAVVYMHLDDLWLGVKSHSNLAMAGSSWNMP